MNPRTRSVVQAVLYEVIAVTFVGPALSLIFDQPVTSAVGLAVLMSSVALAWHYVFNGSSRLGKPSNRKRDGPSSAGCRLESLAMQGQVAWRP